MYRVISAYGDRREAVAPDTRLHQSLKRLIRTSLLGLGLLSCLGTQLSSCLAQGTAFTYQGRLHDGAAPASGTYDLRFAVFGAADDGTQLGNLLTNNAAVVDGLFTVTLDFGNQFPGAARWLEIAVRTNGGGAFATLAPRQPLTPTPYATTAGNISGVLSASSLPANVVTNGGSFAGNGANVTNVNAATLEGVGSAGFWRTAGNAGTTPGASFLGTTDNRPLELKVYGYRALRFEPNGSEAPNVIGGAAVNSVSAGTVGATIGGGGAGNYLGVSLTNLVAADFAVVGGGLDNAIAAHADNATIGGGVANRIWDYSREASIGGGYFNWIHGRADASTIGGGHQNRIQTNAIYSTISGGLLNWIETNASFGTIGGGQYNLVATSFTHGTVAGGYSNVVSGYYGTIPGGFQNEAGTFALAAGHRAKATTSGSFVWADSQNADFSSTAANQFLIRASGGTGINNDNPVAPLTVAGSGIYSSVGAAAIAVRNTTANKTWEWHVLDDGRMQFADYGLGATRMVIDASGNVSALSFSPTSDRNAKENSRPVDAQAVLAKVAALPITRWNFKDDAATEHIGPMAQDFHAAFGLGADDRHIATVDADGVALAAIQGLNQKIEFRAQNAEVRMQKLEAENAELKARLERLEQLLNARQNGAQ